MSPAEVAFEGVDGSPAVHRLAEVCVESFDPRRGYIVQPILCGYGVPKESIQGSHNMEVDIVIA